MTLQRYEAMQRYWLQHPPVHILVAAYLDYKPPKLALPKASNNNLGELLAMFAGTGGQIPA
jgi:hypothetical protein